jgi:hypothetical protein
MSLAWLITAALPIIVLREKAGRKIQKTGKQEVLRAVDKNAAVGLLELETGNHEIRNRD